MSDISSQQFKDIFLAHTPLIDVRAPVEFASGTLPGAVNIPIMDNEQRAAVGTAYKNLGREEALRLGHELVSGAVKESRLQQWTEQIRQHPETILFCFRGGLRSKITQSWLAERGVHRPLLDGGYKKARQFLRDEIEKFSTDKWMLMLSGPTGSAKTHLLAKAASFYPTIDLESLARHRGSAFGSTGQIQPSQIDFENTLAAKIMGLSTMRTSQNVLVEDESRLIGRCAIPENFFLRMRSSEMVYIEESFEQRVENIFQDYVVKTAIGQGDSAQALVQFQKFRQATLMISKKLGGVRAQEVLQDILHAENSFLKDPKNLESNKAWISKLLTYYYDPFYTQSLAKRAPRILAKGNAASILDFLRGRK